MLASSTSLMNLPPVLLDGAGRDVAMMNVAAQPQAAATDFRQALLAKLKATGANQFVQGRDDQAHQAAEQFVSTAMVMPMLKQLRNSPFKSAYLHGGKGEDTFGPQLDQILSDRIVQRMSTPMSTSQAGSPVQGQTLGLVDAVYKQLTQQRGNSKAAAAAGSRVNTHG